MGQKIRETSRYAVYYDSLFGVVTIHEKSKNPYHLMLCGASAMEFVRRHKKLASNNNAALVDALCTDAHYFEEA